MTTKAGPRFYAQDSDRVWREIWSMHRFEGGELPTSRSMIFVTPDGERSMNTYLGMSAELGPDDVDERVMSDSEDRFPPWKAYLFDKDKGKDAFLKAARACPQHRRHGRDRPIGPVLRGPPPRRFPQTGGRRHGLCHR